MCANGSAEVQLQVCQTLVTLVQEKSEWSDPCPDLLTMGKEPPVYTRHDTNTNALEKKKCVGLPSN